MTGRRGRAAARPNSKGSVIFEFTLVAAFFYIPLLLGTLVIGLNLVRSIQVTQLTRDAGHMWAQGVDFSLDEAAANNRKLVLRLAGGLNITDAGGNGVIMFSQIQRVSHSQCVAGGLSDAECTNLDHYVVTRRSTIGNSSLRSSAYGARQLTVDQKGNVANYLHNPQARADNFAGVLALPAGGTAYPVESYVSSSDYDWAGYMSGTGMYSAAVF
jgi:hypothetical protein